MPSLTPRDIRKAEKHLAALHPNFARAIKDFGPCSLRPHADPFVALVGTVVSQLISVKAADTIEARLHALVAPKPLTPRRLLALSHDQLRGVGLSNAKARTVREIAERIVKKVLRLDDAADIADAELEARLLDIPGIGPWSVHMYQIFVLCRPDILPIGDMGLRMGVRDLYGLPALPSPKDVAEIASPWRPHGTVATWYVWRSRDWQTQRPA